MKSKKIKIGISMMRSALLAMGHDNVWFSDTKSQAQIITWNGHVAAVLNQYSESWEIQPGANGTFSNPEGIEPADAKELTEEYAFQLSTVYP